jgi:hypothetical protein
MLLIVISSIRKAPIVCSLKYLLRVFYTPRPFAGAKIFLLRWVRTASSTAFLFKEWTIIIEKLEMLFHFTLQVFYFLAQTLFGSSSWLTLIPLYPLFRIISIVYTNRSCVFVRDASRYTTGLEGHQIFFVPNWFLLERVVNLELLPRYIVMMWLFLA